MPPDTETQRLRVKPAPQATWADAIPDVDRYDHVTIDELLELVEQWLQPRVPLPRHYADTITAAPLDDHVTAHQLRHWQTLGILPRPIKRWHDGATRALYPKEPAALAIMEVLTLQDEGYTLDEIGPRMQARFFKPWALRHRDPFNWRAIASRLAAEYTETTGTPTAYVQFVFIDPSGERDVHQFPITDRSRDPAGSD